MTNQLRLSFGFAGAFTGRSPSGDGYVLETAVRRIRRPLRLVISVVPAGTVEIGHFGIVDDGGLAERLGFSELLAIDFKHKVL